MSDTPRTDAFTSCSPMFGKSEISCVADFARGLERELAEAKRLLRLLADAVHEEYLENQATVNALDAATKFLDQPTEDMRP